MMNDPCNGAPRVSEAGTARRSALALACALALIGAVGCGDSADLVPPAESSRVAAFATVKVPVELPATWTLPAEGVRFASDGERAGLVFEPGAEALSVSLPVPPEAAGAGRVMVRVLSDGAFGVGIVLGSYESKVARSGDTRRLWKELQFPLTAPLAGEALTVPMRIVRASAEQPVLLEAISFLP
jgi:hypothetical protein